MRIIDMWCSMMADGTGHYGSGRGLLSRKGVASMASSLLARLGS